MDAEKRTLRAIGITRRALEWALRDLAFVLSMAAADVGPDDVEDVVTEILEYLDKTKDPLGGEAEE